MEQLILAIVIIALGIYVFRFFPFEKGNVTYSVISAIFIVLTLVCKQFLTVMIPLFGTESFKIGLEYLPLLVAGFFLKPSYAFVVGLCSDIVGLIIVPTGFPFLGFTLVMILVCVIPSLVKEYAKHVSEQMVQYLAIGLILILGIGAAIYIYQLESLVISETIHVLTLFEKSFMIAMCLILTVAFIVIIMFLKMKIHIEEAKEFSMWLFAVILVEIICTLCLTPLWLDIMYGIPFILSLCLRIIKECFILPIEIFIGYTLVKIMKRILRRS